MHHQKWYNIQPLPLLSLPYCSCSLKRVINTQHCHQKLSVQFFYKQSTWRGKWCPQQCMPWYVPWTFRSCSWDILTEPRKVLNLPLILPWKVNKNCKDFSPILLLTMVVVVDCLQKENENHNRMSQKWVILEFCIRSIELYDWAAISKEEENALVASS